MPHAYTEDQLVEQPAKAAGPPSPWSSPSGRGDDGLFAEFGWTTGSAMEEGFAPAGTLLRETKGEVVLVSRLRAALERLNPALPPEATLGQLLRKLGDLRAIGAARQGAGAHRAYFEHHGTAVLEGRAAGAGLARSRGSGLEHGCGQFRGNRLRIA